MWKYEICKSEIRWFGVLICFLCSEISFSSHLSCFIIYYSLILLNSSYHPCRALLSASKLLQNKTKQSKQTNKKPQNKEQHPPHISTLEICCHFISLNVVRHLQVWSSGEEVLLVELHLTHFEFDEAETGTLLQIQHLYQNKDFWEPHPHPRGVMCTWSHLFLGNKEAWHSFWKGVGR